jgi:uncharacterized protein YbjT (DUF2867 family)
VVSCSFRILNEEERESMYVITGATGNTGGVIARTLLERGKKVRVIGRSADRLQSLASAGAEPFVCDLTNAAALASAFTDASAVYVMIPPNATSPDFRAYQDGITNGIAAALEQTGVKYAVSLSSLGADKSEKTGPVLGLHHLERRLNEIVGLNVLHVRAGYFMENTLAQIGVIKTAGITAGALRPDLKLPMIATRDIGRATAEALLKLEFNGQRTRELLGQRDISMTEASAIIGKAIDKPDLKYVQVSDEEFQTALTQFGLSQNVASLIVEMAVALNSGHMAALESRSAQNTTPIPFETFVAEEFLPRYQAKSATA